MTTTTPQARRTRTARGHRTALAPGRATSTRWTSGTPSGTGLRRTTGPGWTRGAVRTGLLALASAALAAALTVPAAAHPTGEGGHPTGDTLFGRDGDHGGHLPTTRAMTDLVAAGVPGVSAQVRDRAGTWRTATGVGDLRTGRPRGADDRYRVGSVTKTFVAASLLLLEGDGRLDLDDPVERWLPGLVRGGGSDGRRITVRQLLNHTSGIPDYIRDEDFRRTRFHDPGFRSHRFVSLSPRRLVRTALAHPAAFRPGTSWGYSNTNYVLAGLVIEAVTGRPYGETVRDRIVRPLGLRATTVPGTDPRLPDPHSRAYGRLSPDPRAVRVHDVTLLDPSMAYAAGEMISSSADLTRFLTALLRGELLTGRQLAAMTSTVETAPGSAVRYGLGVLSVRTRCGVRLWGHGGDIPGSVTQLLGTRDGGHVLAYNLNGDWAGTGAIERAEFCGAPDGDPDSAPGDDPRDPH
ncbi:serine hydrolase domain-containing protein [Streptomyces sp. JNUCC 64]